MAAQEREERPEIRHGWTIDGIDHASRLACRMAHGWILDHGDRYDAAWHAIAELLYTSDTPPDHRAAVRTAIAAINRHAQDYQQTWGMTREWGAGEGGRDSYQRYWALCHVTGSPEDRVVDAHALRQIWPRLHPTQQAVLMSLATWGDQASAAAAIGKSYTTFGTHMKHARRAFFALWHEHETPSRIWGKTDHRRSQRYSATQTLRHRHREQKRREEKACA